MPVKICGHKISWHKPIKIYALFKAMSAALCLVLFLALSPALAADAPAAIDSIERASSGGAGPCTPPLASTRMENPVSSKAAPTRDQRAAGPQFSPAMALALAFGLRNVSGPMERADIIAMEK